MSTAWKDQCTYTTDAVEAFLPSVWDSSFVLSARPRRAAANGLRTKSDPRHVPDWLLAVADVQVGYSRAGLDRTEKECLRNVHHLGFTPGELGPAWNVPAENIVVACMSGIEKIASYLNGEVPR